MFEAGTKCGGVRKPPAVVMGGSLLLAPPPERPLPQDVYVVKLRRTIFGVSHGRKDDTSTTGITAFVDPRRAAQYSEALWRHRLATGEWPDRVLMPGQGLELYDCGGTSLPPNVLRVDRVPREPLVKSMGLTGAGVDIVHDGVDPRRPGPFTLSGSSHRWTDEDAGVLAARRTFFDELYRKRFGGVE